MPESKKTAKPNSSAAADLRAQRTPLCDTWLIIRSEWLSKITDSMFWGPLKTRPFPWTKAFARPSFFPPWDPRLEMFQALQRLLCTESPNPSRRVTLNFSLLDRLLHFRKLRSPPIAGSRSFFAWLAGPTSNCMSYGAVWKNVFLKIGFKSQNQITAAPGFYNSNSLCYKTSILVAGRMESSARSPILQAPHSKSGFARNLKASWHFTVISKYAWWWSWKYDTR